jgi:ketosteroid isomerase-like protein
MRREYRFGRRSRRKIPSGEYRVRYILFALLAVTASAHCADRALPKSYESLAAAEREFAAAGLRDGVQKSFLAHFAEDSIVLHPFAVSAPEWYRGHPDRPGRLIWGPQYLAVSSAGDLGLSSGPWRLEVERDGKLQSYHGHFFSLWKRDAHGRWQVVFDHGIGHDAPAISVEKTELSALAMPEGAALAGRDSASRRQALEKADDALRARLAQNGGYAQAARADTLWVREQAVPAQSATPPAPAPGKTAACGCGPRAYLAVSDSGDLGYTIGGGPGARDKGVDVRVWRFDAKGGWTLLADLSDAVD